MKRALLTFIGLTLAAVLIMGFSDSVSKISEVNSVINELSVLTDNAIRNIDDPPTLANIATARNLIDEQKQAIKNKIKALRDSGKLADNSDANLKLSVIHDANKNKLAAVYDKFVAKSYEDMKKMNKAKGLLIKLNSQKSSKEFKAAEKDVESLAAINEANLDLLNALDTVVESYKSIFDEK